MVQGGTRLSTYNCSNYTSGGKLTTDSNGYLVCGADTGGTGSPGGNNQAVQFNNATAFGGDETNFSWDNTNKNLGIGTSTPIAQLAIEMNTHDYSLFIGDQGSSTPALVVTGDGKIGIGTSTPWAALTVIATTSKNRTTSMDSYFPAFLVATTSANTQNQFPLFFVTSTTTGALDYARVAVGTTTSRYGSATSSAATSTFAGLRDQFTVAGRIYSTWRYASCDFAGLSMVAPVTADTSNICGPFGFEIDTDAGLRVQVEGVVPVLRLVGGSTNATGGDGASLGSSHNFVTAPANPVMDAWVRWDRQASSIVMVGFVSKPKDPSATFELGTEPGTGIYFVASTTAGGSVNWHAVTRNAAKGGGVGTYTNTRIAPSTTTAATSSPFFDKLRIEASSNIVYFLLNGEVVATHTTNIPEASLSLNVSIGVTASAGTSRQMDVSLIRLWMDDPPGGLEIDGGGDSGPALPFDPVQGADIAEAYLADDLDRFKEGMIVSDSQNGIGKVALSGAAYDKNIYGVISTSPHLVMGDGQDGTVRVGLVGRVPVYVSLANGVIEKGDRITSSLISGIGMRASRPGYIVGRAMQGFNPEKGLGQCDATLLDLNSTATTTAGTLIATSSGISSGIGFSGIATSTLKGADCRAKILIKLDTGFDMGIGDVVQDIGEKVTDALGALVELTNEAFIKGAELTRIIAGKIISEVAVVREFFAKAITILPGGSINVPAGEHQIAGEGVLSAGANSVLILNNRVASTSKIFLTPRVLLDSPLAITEIREGEGFVVGIAKSASVDILFDWLMVNSYAVGPGSASVTVPGTSPSPGVSSSAGASSGGSPSPGTSSGSGGAVSDSTASSSPSPPPLSSPPSTSPPTLSVTPAPTDTSLLTPPSAPDTSSVSSSLSSATSSSASTSTIVTESSTATSTANTASSTTISP